MHPYVGRLRWWAGQHANARPNVCHAVRSIKAPRRALQEPVVPLTPRRVLRVASGHAASRVSAIGAVTFGGGVDNHEAVLTRQPVHAYEQGDEGSSPRHAFGEAGTR
jgi:hypothetical protein